MKAIWKFGLLIGQKNILSAPGAWTPLRIGFQGDNLFLWAEVIPGQEHLERCFQVYGTGHPIPIDAKYSGSASSPPYEWHVFEEPTPEHEGGGE